MKIVRMKSQKKHQGADMFVVLSLVQSVIVILIIGLLFIFTKANAGALQAVRRDLDIIFGEDVDLGGYFTPSEEKTEGIYPEPAVFTDIDEKVQSTVKTADTPDLLSDTDASEKIIAVPVSGCITSFYGNREHPVYSGDSFHGGVDIAADEGTDICAVKDGIVTEAGTAEMAGNYIRIDHGGGKVTLYCHCSELYAEAGDEVSAGDVIAAVGQTGLATGPHLHLEVSVDGKNADPLEVFPELKLAY